MYLRFVTLKTKIWSDRYGSLINKPIILDLGRHSDLETDKEEEYTLKDLRSLVFDRLTTVSIVLGSLSSVKSDSVSVLARLLFSTEFKGFKRRRSFLKSTKSFFFSSRADRRKS